MSYQPGDVANGHVLNTEGQWLPVASAPSVMRLDRDNYWARWLRRWKWSAIAAFAAFVVVLFAGSGVESLSAGTQTGAVLMSVFSGLVVGTLVNFAVAAFPSRRA